MHTPAAPEARPWRRWLRLQRRHPDTRPRTDTRGTPVSATKETVEEIVISMLKLLSDTPCTLVPTLSKVISDSSYLCHDRLSLHEFLHLLGCEPNKTEIIK
jgi:hypothetical protein